MKVKHLILRLQECDPEALVVVDGYEQGLEPLKNIVDSIEIALDVHTEWYYGKHDFIEYCKGDQKAKVVYLPRS